MCMSPTLANRKITLIYVAMLPFSGPSWSASVKTIFIRRLAIYYDFSLKRISEIYKDRKSEMPESEDVISYYI